MTASVFGYRKPQLTLCWLFLYSSEQENTHLIRLHFWHLRQALTDFIHWIPFSSSLFWLWIPLICSELAGLPTGLWEPRKNTKSGAHNLWGHAPRKFWDFTCSEACSGGFWGFFSCIRTVHMYLEVVIFIYRFQKRTTYRALASRLHSSHLMRRGSDGKKRSVWDVK